MLPSLQRSDPEYFTLFSQKHKANKDTHTDIPISGMLQVIHCLLSPFVENGALPHFTILLASGMDLPAAWKGMLSPCYQTRMGSHSRRWHDEFSCPHFSSNHNYVLYTVLCRLLKCGRCNGHPREPSSADIMTVPQGRKGAVLKLCHSCTRQRA